LKCPKTQEKKSKRQVAKSEESENRFKDILVIDDESDIIGKNVDGRVLFRFNKMDRSFAVFRSPRMTDAEVEFCAIMFERLPTMTDMTKAEIISALRYEIDEDVYCV